MKVYDLDGTIIIQSEHRVHQPFEDAPAEPTPVDSVTIDIYHEGTKVVDSVLMDKHDDGQYYYVWSTDNESEGDYGIKITPEYSGTKGVESGAVGLENGKLIG